MNVLEAIYARKSIRKFKDEAVPKEDILKMLEAATQALHQNINKTGILLY